jgi:hypothetical protein
MKYYAHYGHKDFILCLSQKIEALLHYYESQREKHWFDKETFVSLLRVRGLEIASPTRYAEAFHLKKVSY